MNFILGSGITGLIAKTIFPDHILIPFKKSRYFHLEIPLADNFIKCDKRIDDFMSDIDSRNKIPIFYKQPFSLRGQLFTEDLKDLKEVYFKRVYETGMLPIHEALLKPIFSIYQTTAQQLHNNLQQKFLGDINQNIKQYGPLLKIDMKEKVLKFNEHSLQYDSIISTIPLDALIKLLGMNTNIKAKSICYYDIIVKHDLEGADSCLIVDDYELFKVVKLPDENNYLFWTFDKLDNPYGYFGQFIGYNIDIRESMRIENAMPIGPVPNIEFADIECVGSNAEWDDFADISTNIVKLLRLRNG